MDTHDVNISLKAAHLYLQEADGKLDSIFGQGNDDVCESLMDAEQALRTLLKDIRQLMYDLRRIDVN